MGMPYRIFLQQTNKKGFFFGFIHLFIVETIHVKNYSVDHCKVMLEGKAQNVNW